MPTATRKSSGLKRFADGNERHSYPNGEEFTIYHDGSLKAVNGKGDKIIEYPDGRREVSLHDGQATIQVVGQDLMSIKDV